MERAKYWLLTYFPVNVPFRGEPRPRWEPERLEYLRCNPETSPATGRFHWQIFAACRRRMRRSQLLRCLGILGRTHAEVAQDVQRCQAYCHKQETQDPGVQPMEEGQWAAFPRQGRRTDLERVCWLARQGADLREIASQYPGQVVRYHRGIERLIGIWDRPTLEAPQVYIWWGETGSGKTSEVFRRWDVSDIYVKSVSTKWFDLYHSERV